MAAGVLLLLDLLGILDSAALVWPLIFAAAGAAFLTLFLRSRDNWWAAIPGSVFLGLAAVITLTQLWPGAAEWGGAVFFLFMGSGFGAVYVRERSNWWALIPCGVMLTLALVVALPQAWGGIPVAAVLFLGLAATFAALSLVPVHPGPSPSDGSHPGSGPIPGPGSYPDRSAALAGHPGPAAPSRMKWPLIPAAVLAVLGLIFALQATALLTASEFFVPVFLVLAGVALLVYAYRHRGGAHPGAQHNVHGA
ncbi:hypothetical protein [Arthrobacter sp. PsM3]|uniref:hypothetical protein n=1 Tax=Arthrobacter sp. PsM3 TaxID=3030531 RepID=UPI00263A88DA|nr:hypothetical protein [Arthrobacter sp. PsM3]MDN4644543.1 hypothetical protein [Arthrobacter sp. PsM3]